MYAVVLPLFLCYSLVNVGAVHHCCKGENVLVRANKTCSDNSTILALPCHTWVILGPMEESPTTFEISLEDKLIITDDENMGYITVPSNKYCLTKDSATDAEVVMTCIEIKQVVHPTHKFIILLSIKALCALITVLFLLAVFAVYLFVPELRDIEGRCIRNFIAFMCAGHLVIIALPIATYLEPRACNTTTFIHFTSLLLCYNWLTVMSFHIWRITTQPVFQPHIQWFLFYCCYGYGLPLILLTAVLIIHYTRDKQVEEVGDFQCWVDGSMVVWGYFYGPVMVMLLISIVLQYFVARKIWVGLSERDCSPSQLHLRKKSLIYMHLLLIMTLVKIMDIITYVYLEKNQYLDYLWQISDCRNLLLGGVMFFIFIVQRNKVLKALATQGLFCLTFPQKWAKLIDGENEAEFEETALTRASTSL